MPGAGEARDVLVLYSNNRLLPANIEGDRGLREALPEGAELSAEFLDYPRITGEDYLVALIRFLREKYATRPPAVIVAGGPDAMAFVLSRRAELFPQVPVVHMGVPRARLRALQPLPADVVGVPFDLDFSATIDQALRWHPSARRLVLVTGSAAPDLGFEALLREEAVRFQERVATEFLAGLPTDALLQRLGELDGESVVFTTGYFQDGAGRNFIPSRGRRRPGRRRPCAGLCSVRHLPGHRDSRGLHADLRGHGRAGGAGGPRDPDRCCPEGVAPARGHARDPEPRLAPGPALRHRPECDPG